MSFWQVLSSGVDTLGPIPPERFDRATYYDPDPEHRGTSYVKEASLLNDVAGFDAAFFGISPREAVQIDPQHRLLLEVTWSALEDAGIVPKSLAGSTTGLFIGIGPNEYQTRGFNLEEADAYAATGGGAAFSAGRLAYHLGVQGPVMAVDTACSSALVALHLASEHLRSGRCDLAIVGGVQVASSAEAFVVLSQTHALAADGRSKTFSEAADGYGRGEGAAVVAMMRLEDAQAQGKTNTRRGARNSGQPRRCKFGSSRCRTELRSRKRYEQRWPTRVWMRPTSMSSNAMERGHRWAIRLKSRRWTRCMAGRDPKIVGD